VIVASETHAKFIDTGWAAVRRHPHVIGDFTWTGWDYLGEAGIGRVEYPQPGDAPAFEGAFPWLAAWCGDIDITGHRRPQSYYREIVFGLRTDPYIAVQRPEHHGKTAQSTPWSWSDSVASWSWDGHEGSAVTVEVYADADEIDLVINKELVSTAPAGPENGYRAVFETRYEPGHVEVVARTSGRETGRAALQSAEGDVLIDLEIDRAVISADPGDLAIIRIRLVDASGTVHRAKDCGVEVAIEGPGVLQALGSANPAGDGRFCASSCTTFDGEALAIVRPTGSGAVTLNVTAESGATARGSIDVRN
jgi:beta-galactosidase